MSTHDSKVVIFSNILYYLLARFLVCQGYFGDQELDLRKITENQVLIGRLLFTFQLGMNFNQHGRVTSYLPTPG